MDRSDAEPSSFSIQVYRYPGKQCAFSMEKERKPRMARIETDRKERREEHVFRASAKRVLRGIASTASGDNTNTHESKE